MSTGLMVMKFGGELLDDAARLRTTVAGVAEIVAAGTPLVIVHGAGKEIDAALNSAGIGKHQVDGLRITDEATLDIVVSVVAGAVNTRFVAALTTAGVAAVGLTGADAGCGRSDVAPRHESADGRTHDLGRVGVPACTADMRLIETLVEGRFVPVIACIGVADDGRLLNVNADTFAGHLAARLGARRLVVAGTTAGVLDANGATLPRLDAAAIAALVHEGTATAGMIAKLRACEHALAAGVDDVVIVDGRDLMALEAAGASRVPATATRLARLTPPAATAERRLSEKIAQGFSPART
jgi:acetylglutamate kinase